MQSERERKSPRKKLKGEGTREGGKGREVFVRSVVRKRQEVRCPQAKERGVV